QQELKKAWSKLSDNFETNDAVALGPGWGVDEGRRELLRRILRTVHKPIVLDADGLNNLSHVPDWPIHVLRHTRRGGAVILTPHAGEIQRLLDSARIKLSAIKDRRSAAVRLAELSGAVIVLKGAGTIVTDGRRIYINRTGNPGMATGGTGDVLTGVIAA